MKKWLWTFGILAVVTLIGVSILGNMNKYPTLYGNEVYNVRIFNAQYKLVALWTIDPKTKWLTKSDKQNRKVMQQLLEPFNDRNLVDGKTGSPNYWVRIDTKEGNGYNYLIWLNEGAPAGFVENTDAPRSFKNTENLPGNQYFAISEQEQHQILEILKSKLTQK
ncbi:hypothetical protein [Paenibacillus albus]|uniref:Uncharacterized protein n=1 Tax=Paenibacillus albus TaxID=2495582 RepID=A0A3S9A7H0_9BACL|nr:hypothetical protein [Paenibacillus albus]AZN41708.1 hypothetical protein EJC50_20045 [Paenibacillus albus]